MLWCYFFIYLCIYLFIVSSFIIYCMLSYWYIYITNICHYLVFNFTKPVSFFVIQLAFCFIYEILIKITSWVLLFWKPKPLIFLQRSISTYSLSIQSYRIVPPLIRKCLPKAGNTWNCEEPWTIWETFSPNVWVVTDSYSIIKEQWVETSESGMGKIHGLCWQEIRSLRYVWKHLRSEMWRFMLFSPHT